MIPMAGLQHSVMSSTSASALSMYFGAHRVAYAGCCDGDGKIAAQSVPVTFAIKESEVGTAVKEVEEHRDKEGRAE